jgi:Rad3-related DNA helicase
MQHLKKEAFDNVYSPREHQLGAIDFVNNNFSTEKNLIIHAQVGAGKSSLLRSFQRKYGGVIITPENVLVNQYVDTYAPDLNHFIGKSNYKCEKIKTMPCHVSQKIAPCHYAKIGACKYNNACGRFENGDATVTNLMMAWIYREEITKLHPNRYIDEFHRTIGIVRSITNNTWKFKRKDFAVLKKTKLRMDDLFSDVHFTTFLRAYLEETDLTEDERFRLNALYFIMKEKPQEFVRTIKDTTMKHYNVKLNPHIFSNILGKRNVVCSGTLLPHDIAEIFGDAANYKEYRVPNVIPAENKPIVFWPQQESHAFGKLNTAKLCEQILQAINISGKNAICHITYGMGDELIPLLKKNIGRKWKLFTFEDNDLKKQTVDEFKLSAANSDHNLLIGGGLSEGLDLKGDLARLNIITKIMFPNMGDEFVKKRMALSDGQVWYTLETLKVLLQQIGRTTRGPDDWSVTAILDPAVSKLIADCKKLGVLTQDFIESIRYYEKTDRTGLIKELLDK